MRIITGDRGSGKTTALAEWLLQGDAFSMAERPDRIIVTASAQTAKVAREVVRQVAVRRGLSWGGAMNAWVDSAVVSVENGVSQRMLDDRIKVAVDDVDAVLAALLHTDVSVATATASTTSLLLPSSARTETT